MASRPPFRFDPLRLRQTLARHQVEHILVGGVAGRLRGSPLVTEDVDLVPHPVGDNYDRLAAAYPGVPAAHPPLGRVDVMNRLGDGLGHAALLASATPFDLGDGVVVLAAGLDDVIASKEAADRPKDRGALPILYELREELRRRDQA